jgi:MoxR-like ATPase
MTTSQDIECKECGYTKKDFLGDHLLEVHQMTAREYLDKYPGAPTASKRLIDRFNSENKNPRRALPPKPEDLTISFAGIKFPINTEVPKEACLPMPAHYRVPRFGGLGEDIQHAAVALRFQRSIYVWGLPGSGKDALFHAWSAMTRTPAIIRQVKPGVDIESWFFSRGFDEKGTRWEEGKALQALRDGYITADGTRIPYMMLVTDFDRADRAQAEHLRLITDSIQGRIDGPAGMIYKVLPGTIITATANTAGAGDNRGRMISANPLDASLMDRFERKFNFRWMDWRDEVEIIRVKFPVLTQRVPSIFVKMGLVTKALREAVLNGDLYGEFSHRALCSILGHAGDMLACTKRQIPKNLLRLASRAWLDGLPDEENRDIARKIMDPHIRMLDEGDTSHIGDGGIADGWS